MRLLSALLVALLAPSCGAERPSGSDASRPPAEPASTSIAAPTPHRAEPARSADPAPKSKTTMSHASDLEFHAVVAPTTGKAGPPRVVTLTVKNHSAATILVPNPALGGDSLTFRLKPPQGDERVFTSGSATRVGGVPPMPVNADLVPGLPWPFEFDLGALTPLDAKGRYTLVLEYTWSPGERWRSPELVFNVTP